MKPIHRLILKSAVYRQAGTADTAPMKVDADNTLLWHWRPNRLEAEAIRDSLLAVAGVLKPDMYRGYEECSQDQRAPKTGLRIDR